MRRPAAGRRRPVRPDPSPTKPVVAVIGSDRGRGAGADGVRAARGARRSRPARWGVRVPRAPPPPGARRPDVEHVTGQLRPTRQQAPSGAARSGTSAGPRGDLIPLPAPGLRRRHRPGGPGSTGGPVGLLTTSASGCRCQAGVDMAVRHVVVRSSTWLLASSPSMAGTLRRGDGVVAGG